MRPGAVVWLVLAAACASRPAARPEMTTAEWQYLGAALTRERTLEPAAPWGARLQATLREPRTGRVFDGRGAIAVLPGRAVRMVVLGGAGVTVLDAWVTPDQWRVAVPPLDMIRRGGAESPDDLPVAFLRWWFFTPLDGSLVGGDIEPSGLRWLLHRADATIDVRRTHCTRGELLTARRRAAERSERIEACRAGPTPAAGDFVRYVDEAGGLRVDMSLESIQDAPPPEAAFRSPDAAAAP